MTRETLQGALIIAVAGAIGGAITAATWLTWTCFSFGLW